MRRGSNQGLASPSPAVTVVAGTVLVLLPALAWLQYSWLDQIAAADRERRTRTVQTAASQLAADVDGELGRAFAGLQIDSTTVKRRTWNTYSQRYSAWAASAVNPAIVEAVYLAEVPTRSDRHHRKRSSKTDPVLRRWMPLEGTFVATAWPPELEAVRERARHAARQDVWEGRRGDRFFGPLAIGDEHTLIGPILDVESRKDGRRSRPPDVRLVGFTLIRLNLDVVRDDLLPALVRRHFFDSDGGTEYRVAVVRRAHPEDVLYESEPGAAEAVLPEPDASTMLLSARLRPIFFVARDERREGPAPEANSEKRLVINLIEARRTARGSAIGAGMYSPLDGHWQLAVKHRAGSLEAAVAGTRARNLALSSGILVLLAVAVVLLVVSARRADRLARRQTEFVGAVSHELRTPVAVIGAAAGNLADGVVGDPDRVRKYGATIQGEARRLAETVERVLQLAGMTAGRAAATAAPVAPAAIVAKALDACRTELATSDMRVEVFIADDMPPVAGDLTALVSAVQNLVSNAAKYAASGRSLRISARIASGASGGRAWPAWLRLDRSLPRTFIDIVVEDAGPGIAAEDRRHIFEAFYRGRNALSQQIQGSGLGLNLVQRIAQAHGGSVTVSSEPGRGSRFTLRLPAAQPPLAARTEALVAGATAPHSGSVA